MDLDRDGHDDILTGSYWPGHVYLFRGKGDGTYAKGQTLDDDSGGKLHGGKPWKSEREPDMNSLAAAPYAADLDGDGDYDLLIGNIAGRVIFKENIGTARAPKFAAEGRPIHAAGKDLSVDRDAGPVCADWNQDGLLDLIVGSDNGAVWCFLNAGTKTSPKFGSGTKLLDSVQIDWQNPPSEKIPPTGHGVRTKICVVDYTGDGRLDLLVGDYASSQAEAPKLSPEQVRMRDALRKEQGELNQAFSELMSDANKAESDEAERLQKKLSDVYEKLRPLESQHVSHGYVWLYVQKGA